MCGSPDYNIPLKPFLNNDPSKPLKPYNSPLKPLNLTKPYNIPLKPYNSPIYNQSTPFNQKQPNTPVKKKPRKKKPRKKKPPRLPKIWVRIIRERTVKKKTSK